MSYVAINRETMKVLFKAANFRAAALISAIDHPDEAHNIFPVDEKPVGCFTMMEMEILHRNMTGQNFNSNNYGSLMAAITDLLRAMPNDQRSVFDLERLAGPMPLKVDTGPIMTRAAQPFKMPSAPSSPVTNGIPSAPRPAAPSIPKAPSAPRTAGATGRVWEIADSQLGVVDLAKLDIKSFRKSVIEACTAEGLNPGTAATQFGKWKASKGL